MGTGGRSPEELETLVEDALVLGDGMAVARLFESTGVLRMLTPGSEAQDIGSEARGTAAIAELAGTVAEEAASSLAAARQLIACEDIALLVGKQSVTVVRRGEDRCWKVAILRLGSTR